MSGATSRDGSKGHSQPARKVEAVLPQESLHSGQAERWRHSGHAMCSRAHWRPNKNPEVQRSTDCDRNTPSGYLQSDRDERKEKGLVDYRPHQPTEEMEDAKTCPTNQALTKTACIDVAHVCPKDLCLFGTITYEMRTVRCQKWPSVSRIGRQGWQDRERWRPALEGSRHTRCELISFIYQLKSASSLKSVCLRRNS